MVKSYQKVLQHYRRGKNLTVSYKAVRVDWNTIVGTAPIAELTIASPEQDRELLKGHSRLQKLQTFVLQCANFIENDPVLLAEIENMKKTSPQTSPFP
ncbi:coiled-coil domain-containing protein 106-like [Xyrichtys novacula]|uniref:Coiled-coil domain-containing protein 106-like n=2 Tax=Xyrichtys novacula TaxID=13765 RepID=A0AAV1EXW6_XYRNO|nr:coiled-coil domain-containing protein 106-like [Xyrichtys novacula]